MRLVHGALVLLGALLELPCQTHANNDATEPPVTFTCRRPAGAAVSFTPFFMADLCFSAQSSHLHFVEVDWGDNSDGTKIGVDAQEGDIICAPEARSKFYIGVGTHRARMWINGSMVYSATVVIGRDGCQVVNKPQWDSLFADSMEAAAMSAPTTSPTSRPSLAPVTSMPTEAPVSPAPTDAPVSDHPTQSPSASPVSPAPTEAPVTQEPSKNPTSLPTVASSSSPSLTVSGTPSTSPSDQPITSDPTSSPTITSSSSPSAAHSDGPSSSPTTSPVTLNPTSSPTVTSSASPSVTASSEPSITASSEPSLAASSTPSSEPTATESDGPSAIPTSNPTREHSSSPSSSPSSAPSAGPTITLSSLPSSIPSAAPTPSPSSGPSAFPTITASDQPSSSPTASPTIADIISDSTGCKDMPLSIGCQAEMRDGTVVDCKSLQFTTIGDDSLRIKWTYSLTNNCPYPRALGRQHMTSCSLCIPPGLQCTKTSHVFPPRSGAERHYTLQPYERAIQTEEEVVFLNSANPCMYSRDVVIRLRGSTPTSVGSFAVGLKYTWVSPRSQSN